MNGLPMRVHRPQRPIVLPAHIADVNLFRFLVDFLWTRFGFRLAFVGMNGSNVVFEARLVEANLITKLTFQLFHFAIGFSFLETVFRWSFTLTGLPF